MKILLTNYSEITSPGGVHKTIREIAKSLSKKGHKVTVLQANPLDLPDEEIYEGFKIIRVKSRFGNYFYGLSPKMYFYIKNHFKELNPDIVHIHGYHTLFSVGVLYKIKKLDKKIPLVFSPHFGAFSHDTLAGKYLWGVYNIFLGKRIFNLVDRIIVASKFERNSVKDVDSISDEKIAIIPHGVDILDTKKIKKNRNETIHLIYGGHLLELKGIQYIIEAVRELYYNFKIQNVGLTIIGEGPYKQNLTNLARKLNVEHLIEWKSFLPPPEFQKELKKADIFLLLSLSENYGITVAEALCLGTPTIVTRRTALKELLDELGCFGIDYPPDPKALSELIIKIHESDIKVGPFSDKIRIWDKVAEDYEKVYAELLKQKVGKCK